MEIITKEDLVKELLAREAREDADEHSTLTWDIVEYIFKYFTIERK